MRMKKTLLTCAFFIAYTVSALAQSNWLDTTFASRGVLFQDSIWITCMLIQPDNKIVLGGSQPNSDLFDFALLRLNPDGSIDSSFGKNGYVFDKRLASNIYSWGNVESIAQQNGKILLAGFLGSETTGLSGQPDFSTIRRYNSDGSIDSSFGTNGIIINYFGNTLPLCISNIMSGTNGRVFLVACNYNSYAFNASRLICYDSTGHIDSTFGLNGGINIYGNQLGYIYSSALQADKKILVGGADSTGTEFSIIRYTASGLIDSTFGNDGIARINCDSDIGGFNYLYVQNDTEILATKYTGTQYALGTAFKLSRFTSRGTVDYSFGQSGCAQTFIPTDVQVATYIGGGASFVSEYPDGKILTAGAVAKDTLLFPGGPARHWTMLAFVRFLPNGIVDSTFGNAGVVFSPPVPYNSFFPTISGLSLLNDGKFISVATDNVYKFLAYAPTPNGIKGVDVSSINIYPDPATDHLYICGLPPSATLCISDMTGRIYSTPSSLREVDVSSLPSGVYLLRIQDSSGFVVKKFVKD